MLAWISSLLQKGLSIVLTAIFAGLATLCPALVPTYTGLPAVDVMPQTTPVYEEGTALLSLIEEGASAYTIVYGAQAAQTEYTAALQMQQYVLEATGCTLPLQSDALPAQGREVLVGKTNREADAYIDRAALGDDGFTIATSGNDLIIAGGEKCGTLYGVFTFLEEYLGYRWFSPQDTLVPDITSLQIPAQLNNTQKPAFAFRHTSWFNAQDPLWRAQMKLQGSMSGIHGSLDETYNEIIRFAGPDAGHTFRFFVPAEQYFETHPEYFAMNEKGQRVSGQVCLANPDVFDLTLAGVRSWLEAYPGAQLVSVSQNDNQNYCRCKECAALDKAEGSPAGSMISFANKIAAAIEDDYPDVMVHTFAYQYTVKPPKTVRPAGNVAVQLCTIDNNHNDIYSVTAKDFVGYLETWSAICDTLFIWDYSTDFGHYHTPFPDLRIYQKNIQLYRDNNAYGCFMQGNSMSLSGEFGELRAYLFAKLMWNPDCDAEKLTEEFLCYYYGPGYPNIQAYMQLLYENRGNTFHIGSKVGVPVKLNVFDLAQAEAWWDACEHAVWNETQLAHVQRSRIQVQYYKSAERKAEYFPLNPNRVAAGQKLYEEMIRLGITHLKEGPAIQQQPDFKKPANEWSQ